MSKTNYEILEENKTHVIQFADNIKRISSSTRTTITTATSTTASSYDASEANLCVTTKYENVQKMVAVGDFGTAIQTLDEIKDNKIGIVWHQSGDLGNGSKALVRDARAVVVTDNLDALRNDAGEKYAMQILNVIRASIKLIDYHHQAQIFCLEQKIVKIAKQKLMHVANTAVQYPSDINCQTILEFNTQIIHILEQTGIGKGIKAGNNSVSAADQLNFAKDVVNLYDEHRHIVTLTIAEDECGHQHTVMEAEILLDGLIETQKKQYEAIAVSKPKSPSGIEWFDKMEAYKQHLLRDVARNLASGTKVIPNQLLGDAIGIRTAYQKVTAMKDPNQEKSTIISATLHCGAPATKIKVVNRKARQQIVNENIKQLQSFVPPGETLNLVILNSKTPANIRGENFIFDQVTKGGKKLGASVSATPINRWRLIGGGRYTLPFKDNLSTIIDNLENKAVGFDNVTKHIKNRNSTFVAPGVERITFGSFHSTETKAKQELDELKKINPDLARDLGIAVEARTLADSPTLLFANLQNVNLELTSTMNIVRNSVKVGHLSNALTSEVISKYPNDVHFCKSGKDRTGYVQKKNTQTVIAHHLGIDTESKIGQINFHRLVAGGHTQEMAGIQGGTIGCHSIKTKPEFAINKEDKLVRDIFYQRSSHFNNKIKTIIKGKDAAEVIKKFEESFLAAPKYNIGVVHDASTIDLRP